MSEQLWAERLNESTLRLAPDVRPELCADRYGVDDQESIEELTIAATYEMVQAGYGVLEVEDLDAAAEQLGVIA